MDFIIKTYIDFLTSLKSQNYSFQTFQEFLKCPAKKTIILRHDVDKLPENSFRFAQIQHELGIKGSYYFRIVSESFNPKIIEKIVKLGHEIGYHYEDVDLVNKSSKLTERDIINHAIKLFDKHLQELRKFFPVNTICMHGSPLSKYDNKLLWKYYNYKDFGIIGEPYFDINFSRVLYLTDTGRKWNGEKVSIRDKVYKSNVLSSPVIKRGESTRYFHGFKKTHDIISAAEKGKLPNQIMFTFHPQRWTDKSLPWIQELIWQNTKNMVKYFLNKLRN